MKTLSAITCTVLLAGCTCAPKVIDRTVEVKVPVPISCVSKAPERPLWATADPSVGTNTYDRFVAVLKELGQRREYELELESLVDSCK